MFLLAALILSPSLSNAAGFVGGDVFEYTSATGDVYVNCPRTGGGVPRGPSSASFRCYGYIFSPAESAEFVGPKLNANEVELTSHRSDGTTFTKRTGYIGSRGVSDDTFNLWIETVFQRSLLKIGRNEIEWTLRQNGRDVQTGSFIAEVYSKPALHCPTASMTGWNLDACTNSNNICDQYYQQYGDQCR